MHINSKYPLKHFFLDIVLGDYLTENYHGHFFDIFTDQSYKRKIMTFQSHRNEIRKLWPPLTFQKPFNLWVRFKIFLRKRVNKTSKRFKKEWLYEFTLKCLQKRILIDENDKV